MENNSCEKIRNPPIHFDKTTVKYLSNPVVPLPALNNGLEPIDTHKDSNGEEFILVDRLDDKVCSQLPNVAKDEDPPTFAQLPDGTWLQFDPRLNLNDNTVQRPLPDGGGIVPILTKDYAQCANVARSLFNEDDCILSSEPTVCTGSYSKPNIVIGLNADSIVAIHNITGLYLYAVKGLPLRSDGDTVASACLPGTKSRWEIKPSSECTATTLDSETLSALTYLLSNSADTNSFIRDITFPSVGTSCSSSATETLEDVSVIIGAQCFQRVHPEHMSVFDMTYCTRDDNPCSLTLIGSINAIREPMDRHRYVFFDYLAQSDVFWDLMFHRFTKIGRFGDSIVFRDLTDNMQLDEVAKYFGGADSFTNSGVIVCGSVNEVANDPFLGDHFDVHTGFDTSFNLYTQREKTWLSVALKANDQLRQRVAWALAQVLVVVPSQVGEWWCTWCSGFMFRQTSYSYLLL